MLPRHKLVFDTGRCPQVQLGYVPVFRCSCIPVRESTSGSGRAAVRICRAAECSAQCIIRPCC